MKSSSCISHTVAHLIEDSHTLLYCRIIGQFESFEVFISTFVVICCMPSSLKFLSRSLNSAVKHGQSLSMVRYTTKTVARILNPILTNTHTIYTHVSGHTDHYKSKLPLPLCPCSFSYCESTETVIVIQCTRRSIALNPHHL